MTDHVPAAAEGLPNLNRRSLLSGLAVVPVAAIPLAATIPALAAPSAEESPALLKAWEEFRAVEDEYYAAKEALEWLADEWKHLWPLAPEEILGGANAQSWDERIERDIVGRPMLRDKTVLTKRLHKRFRQEGEQTCFFIDQPDEISKCLSYWKRQQPRGRSQKGIERNRAWIAKTVAGLKIRLRLARQYHAETKRLIEASGSVAVQSRLQKAKDAFEPALRAVFRERPVTTYGLRLKADALAGYFEHMGMRRDRHGFIGNSLDLAYDTLDLIPDVEAA